MSRKLVLARLLTALTCCLLAGDFVRASGVQDGGRKLYAETEDELDALLWERDRELLHRGAPLEVSGLESGDNTFRDGTPALARTNASLAQVDLDALHKRKLAMYSERAAFHTPIPLSASARPGSSTGRGAARGAREASPSTGADGASGSMPIGGVLGLVTLVMLFIVGWRARQELS